MKTLIKTNDFNDMPLEEFLRLPYFNPDKGQKFRNIIIVPLPETHESGFRLMKFILVNADEVVGVVGGSADIMWLLPANKYVWSIDCLKRSRCLRIFTVGHIIADPYGGSDFFFKATE